MGVSLTSVEKLKRAVKMARDNKLQLAVHAMGDKAIQTVIDVTKEMEPWLTTMPSVRIEHASLMTDQMFAKIANSKMNYALVTQPIFFFAEDESYRHYLSPAQFKLAYRVKTMLNSRAMLGLSSDAPCTPWAEPDSPFYSIYAAVTRRQLMTILLTQKKQLQFHKLFLVILGMVLRLAALMIMERLK